MNPIPEAARSGLEKYLKEDLAGAILATSARVLIGANAFGEFSKSVLPGAVCP